MVRLFLLCLYFACVAAHAATWWVRTDGSNATCNGTADASSASAPNCAYATIQTGVNAAQAGDTVSVRTGTYASTVATARSGTSGSRITIEAAGSDTVTISNHITLTHNYITFQKFRVTNISSGGTNGVITVNGTNANVLNNYIYSNSSGDYNNANAIAMVINGNSATIDSNTFDGTSDGTNSIQPTIYIVINIWGDDAVISNNLFENMIDCERVFEINGGNRVTIRNNEIKNIYAWDYNVAHVDVWQSWMSPGPQNYIIENNYIHDLGTAQIANLRLSDLSSLDFRNNIFANIGGSFFIGTRNTNFYNNVFYHTATIQDHPLLFNYDNTGNNFVYNNTFVGNGSGDTGARGWYAGTLTASNNHFSTMAFGTKSSAPAEGGTAVNGGNPQFTTVATDCISTSCNFHIGATSVLIGEGTTVGSFSVDKDGNTRSAPWDIGAYEYAASGPSAPTNFRLVRQFFNLQTHIQ